MTKVKAVLNTRQMTDGLGVSGRFTNVADY